MKKKKQEEARIQRTRMVDLTISFGSGEKRHQFRIRVSLSDRVGTVRQMICREMNLKKDTHITMSIGGTHLSASPWKRLYTIGIDENTTLGAEIAEVEETDSEDNESNVFSVDNPNVVGDLDDLMEDDEDDESEEGDGMKLDDGEYRHKSEKK
eukprot:Skav219414  [mRNA]  locus=scaffold377:232523:232981:+ [translate_table: standard]